MDGANVEIYEEVGPDNIFFFGLRAEEVAQWRPTYSPWDIYFADQEIQNVLDTIRQNAFSVLSPGVFDPIVRTLLDEGDYYMHLADLRDFADTQDRVAALYRDQREWSQRTALSLEPKFSSDRTIAEYARRSGIEPMVRGEEKKWLGRRVVQAFSLVAGSLSHWLQSALPTGANEFIGIIHVLYINYYQPPKVSGCFFQYSRYKMRVEHSSI